MADIGSLADVRDLKTWRAIRGGCQNYVAASAPHPFLILRLHDTSGPNIGTMDAKRFDVDPEWAEKLEGLPMAVPEYWWVGFTSRTRCIGKIKKVNCNARNYAYFFLELDSARGTLYGMRYDDVLLYANDEHPDYNKYELLANPPLHPKHESSVRAKPGGERPRPPKSRVAKPVATRPAKRGKKQQRQQKKRNQTDDDNSASEVDDDGVPYLIVSCQL